MKIASISATILAFATPLAAVSAGGLKGTERTLQDFNPPNPPSTWTNTHPEEAKAGELPTLDALNDIYGTFCDICEVLSVVNELLGLDASFCFLCDVVDEIPDPSEIACFSELSTVQVEDAGSVTMRDLQVGDRILTQSGAYESVYAFGHRNPTVSTEFLQFKTAETSLEITGGHLVFLAGKTNPVRADSVQVGDVFQGNNAKIMKIRTVQRDGVYTPLTPSGTVVVDGITASSYISLQKGANEFVELQGGMNTWLSFQDLIHMGLSPFRMLCMGVSSSLGNVYTEEGIPLYAAYGMKFAKWADNQNIVIQFFLFLAFGALAGASLALENVFGASTAPLAMAAGAGVYAMIKKSGIRFTTASKTKSV